MKFARIENDTIVETIDFDPTGLYHEDIIWTAIDESVVANAELVDGVWVNPAIEPEPEPEVVEIDAVINITSPVSTTVDTPTTIVVTVVDENDVSEETGGAGMIGVNSTYFIPLQNIITKELDQIIQIDLVDGVATTEITIAAIGIYDVMEDLIRPIPTARMATTIDIVVV